MSKKVSLKDAFVRNLQTADQPSSYTASQIAVEPAVQPPPPAFQLASATAIQPAASTAIPIPSDLAIQLPGYVAVQPAVNPSTQPTHKKKATFNLDASLHQRLKIAAAIHSREMVDIVEDALLSYLPHLDQKEFRP